MTSTGSAKPYRADSDEDGGTECLFHLDEPEGSPTVRDSSGKGHVGEVCGTVILGVAGRFDTAADFSGFSGSEIAVPDAAELEVGDALFTLEAQVKMDASSIGAPMAVASKWCGVQSTEAMSY